MKVLRGAVLLVGCGVLGLLGTIEFFLRRRDGSAPRSAAESDPDYVTAASAPLPARAVRRVRTAVGVLGIAIAVFGGYVMLRNVAPASYLGLALWLAAAVALHDFVLVPLLSGLRAAAERAGRHLPGTAIRVGETGFLVGGAITILVVPEIYAKHLGTLNPTVLPGSYGQNLLLTWGLLVGVTVCAVAAITARQRRRVRPRSATGSF